MAKNEKKRAAPRLPRAGALWAASIAALATGGWALFLWQQLLVARSGGEPFCALGAHGCAALWDGAFASTIQAATGLPVAAWGVLWSVVAAILSAFCAWRAQQGRGIEPAWSGLRFTAWGGLGAAALLVAAGLEAGVFCSNCLIIQALVAGFGGLVLWGAHGPAASDPPNGFGLAAGIAALCFAVLWIPGNDTPPAGGHLGAAVLPTSSRAAGSETLSDMISRLSARERQTLANARALHMQARPAPPRAPRALVGDPAAPVRLTTFTDSGCSHCAVFHRALHGLLAVIPAGSLSIEQRVFPLDGSCNPLVDRGGHPELCLAAEVRLCLETDARAFDLAGWLHDEAAPLRPASIYRVAERLAPRATLEACVRSARTAAKLRDDIRLGAEAGIAGTPFLLVNGVPAPAYIPFLYAMVLARGDVTHPAFAALPPPVLVDEHAGHDH